MVSSLFYVAGGVSFISCVFLFSSRKSLCKTRISNICVATSTSKNMSLLIAHICVHESNWASI